MDAVVSAQVAKLQSHISTVLGSPTALNTLLTSTWGAGALETWLATAANRAEYERLWSSPTTAAILAADASLMAAVVGSATASNILGTAVAAAACAASTEAMTAIVGSATAMAVIAATASSSNAPLTFISNSATALAILVASSTAMSALCASPTAMAVLVASRQMKLAMYASDVALAAIAASAVAIAACKAAGQYAVYNRSNNGTTPVDWTASFVSGARYILVGGSVNAVNTSTCTISTRRSGSSRTNSFTNDNTNSTTAHINILAPIEGPFSTVWNAVVFGTTYLGMLRCDA